MMKQKLSTFFGAAVCSWCSLREWTSTLLGCRETGFISFILEDCLFLSMLAYFYCTLKMKCHTVKQSFVNSLESGGGRLANVARGGIHPHLLIYKTFRRVAV